MKAFLLRTCILLCCTFGSTINLFAQDEITIESCKESTGENIAEAQPRNDINGNPCAVFQIETNDVMGLTFPNKNQYVGEVRQSNGTYYVYVPGFSYKLDFQHPDFIPGTINVAPFGFKKSITGGKTYIIKLKAPQKIDNAPHVSFKVSPFVPGTSIVFDGNRKELKQNTDLKLRCNSGTYNYRVEAPNYQTETGTIEVKKGAVPISVQLKPSTVQVNIKCNVSNANVYVDNEYIRNYHVKNNCQLVTYGIYHDADYQACDIVYSPKGSKFNVLYDGVKYPFETKLLGEHNIMNILAAIAIARYLGVDFDKLASSVKNVQYVEHRLEVKKINGYTFIDNAFNSNPSGASMSLKVMSMMPNKRFIVTPGLIDLGDKQDEINKDLGKQMKDQVDVVILVGPIQTKAIYDGLSESGFDMNNVYVTKTVKEAFALVYQLADTKDTILLENDLPDAFNV